eukprot:g2692.t1
MQSNARLPRLDPDAKVLLDLSGTDDIDQNDKSIVVEVEYSKAPWVPHFFIAHIQEDIDEEIEDIVPLRAQVKIKFPHEYMVENAKSGKRLRLHLEHDDILPATFYEVQVHALSQTLQSCIGQCTVQTGVPTCTDTASRGAKKGRKEKNGKDSSKRKKKGFFKSLFGLG